MQSLNGFDPTNLIGAYGYPTIARVIALKSMGLPLPGETMLLTAAVYTGVSDQLGIVLDEAQRAAGAECTFPSLLISLTRTQAH